MDGQDRPKSLIALAFTRPLVPIEPASRWRDWMETAKDRWPNRCLPLLVANESGWTLENSNAFEAVWDGRESPDAVTIKFDGEKPYPEPVRSHFGFGVITWNIPYVFRTPPGWNLLARGPANWPKDGACALEGMVETDWSFANFTMNWKLTRPGHPVRFEEGDPFCMLVPQRRGELETFRPEVRDIASDPEAHEEFMLFSRNREQMQIKKFASPYVKELESYKTDWERQYYKGLAPSGTRAPEHQIKVNLAEFSREDG
jgi:uncharacterized protein DUF6065